MESSCQWADKLHLIVGSIFSIGKFLRLAIIILWIPYCDYYYSFLRIYFFIILK